MLGCWGLLLVVYVLGVHGAPLESPLLTVLHYLPYRVTSAPCREALLEYLKALDFNEDWALSFHDASTKYPNGLLASNGYSLGHFDQCINSKARTFSGKYCLVNVRYTKVNSSHQILPFNRFKLTRNEANLALCLPSLCQAQDIEVSLQDATFLFPMLRHYHVRVKLNENQCTVIEELQEPFAAWVRYLLYLILLGSFLSLLRSYFQKSSKLSDVAVCFSVTRHWRRLLSDEDSISSVHGLRVLALSIVIVGHRAEAIASAPLLNPDSLEKMFESPFNIVVLNGTVFVDTFFTISGFLLSWKILKSSERGFHLNSWQVFIQRYLRLTPSYAVVILLQALFIEKLGSGPLWKIKVGKEAANCQRNWWANLLYINNHYDPQHICIDPSWYLACDTQLMLVGLTVIHPLLHWGRYRLAPLLFAFAAAFWLPFSVTYLNGLDPTVIPDLVTVGRTASNQTNLLLYITAYCRAGPYLVGIATAMILNRLHKSREWPSELFWTRGWYAAGLCMLGSIVLGYPFFTPTEVHPILSAIYAGSFRTVFSLGIAFIIVAGAHGKGGFLSATALLPLSRISFSVYLTHTLWQQLSYSWIRSPLHSSDLFQACLILSDLIICSVIGMVFYLLVERPLSELCCTFLVKKNEVCTAAADRSSKEPK